MVCRVRIQRVKAPRVASLERALYAVLARRLTWVAFLAWLDHAITASSDLAGVRTPVIVDRVPIVTNLVVWVHAALVGAQLAITASATVRAGRKGAWVTPRRSKNPIAATGLQAAIGAVVGIHAVRVIAAFKALICLSEISAGQTIAAPCNDAVF